MRSLLRYTRSAVSRAKNNIRLGLSHYRARLSPCRSLARVSLYDDFNVLVPKSSRVMRLATGFRFVEGPVWIADEHCLLFTDIPANQILRYRLPAEACGKGSWFKPNITVFRYPSGHANGQTLDVSGNLICCEHSHRRVTVTDRSDRLTVLVDEYEGMALNSPNDVVVSRAGHLYFSDPAYGISPEQQEQPVQGVYRVDANSGVLTREIDDIIGPNGLAFSPNEHCLYIVDSSYKRHIRMFDVDSSGHLSGGRVFARLDSSAESGPDGLKVDTQGNVYCAAQGGIWVFNSHGTHLGIITLPEKPSNCAWGGSDLNYLYITAQTSIYRVKLCTRGIGTRVIATKQQLAQ
jgi:gluconolactonase